SSRWTASHDVAAALRASTVPCTDTTRATHGSQVAASTSGGPEMAPRRTAPRTTTGSAARRLLMVASQPLPQSPHLHTQNRRALLFLSERNHPFPWTFRGMPLVVLAYPHVEGRKSVLPRAGDDLRQERRRLIPVLG